MAKTVGIGIQDFDKLVEGDYFYIDKTSFIKPELFTEAQLQLLKSA